MLDKNNDLKRVRMVTTYSPSAKVEQQSRRMLVTDELRYPLPIPKFQLRQVNTEMLLDDGEFLLLPSVSGHSITPEMVAESLNSEFDDN